MKTNALKWAMTALTPAALLVFTSCSSTPEGQSATVVAAEKGVAGGIYVETHQITATVTGIDTANRKVTLVTPEGKKETVKVPPEAINFDQVRIGDQLKVTATDELLVFLRKSGAPKTDGEAALVALSPKGAKPGGIMASTVEVTATVSAIDLKHHKATLKFPDGSSHTVAVREDVDLTQRKVGEEVVIRTTESLAITVGKP